ncbi:hypothetical protein MARI_14800 [Marinobacter sp. JH2]|uniref:cbb3-type cytochrome oxidase assembly protein CcoS n=1 Tax=Marinobacter sp. AL4B TaxID=2871173 RepID=UPI001054A6E1|nr:MULTISPECIES: cbb3-type cytochrome oxidase assembly protein CcoS [unclassified Marinobacter]MBZ0333808.1 cbb3-type cytochrome oxidase assembly protein CcoS [Marinobacter sp. AL4B]QBM17371.1 hypothetical protein MARI_14800 [Marinobacter sp. JH2]
MNIVMLLIPLMLILVALGVLLFSWAVKNGQYDDLDGPAHRILHDDDKDMIPSEARPLKSSAKDNQAQSGSVKATSRRD